MLDNIRRLTEEEFEKLDAKLSTRKHETQAEKRYRLNKFVKNGAVTKSDIEAWHLYKVTNGTYNDSAFLSKIKKDLAEGLARTTADLARRQAQAVPKKTRMSHTFDSTLEDIGFQED